jgi:threonine synthase
MKYKSTRGEVSGIGFTDALLMGLASDSGLLIPESIPDIRAQLSDWRNIGFVDLAKKILPLFIDDIEQKVLDRLIEESFSTFDHPDVVGWTRLDDTVVLELFHGPTLAFKDVALQLLGKLFEHVLEQREQKLNILGATSGDTGSAAIAGVRGQKHVDIFILYPNGRISPLQELQMTTVDDDNVHCLCVDGSFDDCQNLMKTIFADAKFKSDYNLGAVNSVNWARVMAQIIYYAYASLRTEQPANFSVPTGNFGNVFAAYLAHQMGFPIGTLLLATNENDILARFFQTGEYSRGTVHQTISPAMDIQVASNFERFLYYYFQQDSQRLCAFMAEFNSTGKASVGEKPTQDLFRAVAISRDETLLAMSDAESKHGYILDPHTAVGYAAIKVFTAESTAPTICVATAHPAKFPAAVIEATRITPTHPSLDALSELPSRKEHVEANVEAVKNYLAKSVERLC